MKLLRWFTAVCRLLLYRDWDLTLYIGQGLQRAHTITKIIFGSEYKDLTANEITSAFAGDSRLVSVQDSELHSQTIVQLAVAYALAPSKCELIVLFCTFGLCSYHWYSLVAEALRLINMKGLYLNNKPVPHGHYKLTAGDLIDGRIAILRSGKSKHLILASP